MERKAGGREGGRLLSLSLSSLSLIFVKYAARVFLRDEERGGWSYKAALAASQNDTDAAPPRGSLPICHTRESETGSRIQEPLASAGHLL